MAVDYKISSTLAVRDDLSAVLEKITALARKANDQMAALTRNVMKSGQSFKSAADSAEQFEKSASKAFDKTTSWSDSARRGVDDMAKSMANLAAKTAAANKPFNTRSTSEHVQTVRTVTIHETRGAPSSASLGWQPAFSNRIEGQRVMRDIGGSSIAGQQRARAALAGPGGSQLMAYYPGLSVAAGGGGRMPPSQNLPQTFGQPFMPPPMRTIGGGMAGGIGGGGAGVPPSGGGGSGGGSHAGPLDSLVHSYVGGTIKGYGDSMLESLHAPIEKAIELERVTAGLRQKGLGDAQIAEAMKFVRATQIYGTSIIDRARIFNEAQGSFRESGMSGSNALDAAKVMTPALAGYKVAMATLDEKSHAAAEGSFSQLNKVVELMGGLNSSARAQQIVDAVFKSVQSSGKMVTERDIRMFTTQGGSAASGLSDRTIFAALEPLMGEFGGSALGTGMNTAFRNLSGLMAHPSKMMVGEAMKMGIWDRKQIQFNSQGGIGKILDRDKLVNPDMMKLMRTDTVGFVKSLMQTYQAHGITTVAGRERENEILLGRTGAKVYNKMMLQLEVMEHSMAAFDAAHGVDQTNKDQRNSPMQKIMEAQKRYADLQMEFGIVVLPLLISGLERLIPLLKTYAQFVHDHPDAIKVLTVAFIGLAGAMVFGGSVLLLSGAMSGLGIALNILTAGTGVPALIAVLGAPILGPIAIAVAAIGTIAAACYAFRALTKEEVDAAKTDGGARLTPGARARATALGMPDTDSAEFLKGMLAGKKTGEFATGGSNPKGSAADMAAAIKAALNGAVVNMDGDAVGRLVTGHQGREAGRPSTGTSGYDSRLSVLRPDYKGL